MAFSLFLNVSGLSRSPPRIARGSLATPRCGLATDPKFVRKRRPDARTGAQCEPNGFGVPRSTLGCGSLPNRIECARKRGVPAAGAGAAGGVQEEVPEGGREDDLGFPDDPGGQGRGDPDQGPVDQDGKLRHHWCVGLVQPKPLEQPRTPSGTKERKSFFSLDPLHL